MILEAEFDLRKKEVPTVLSEFLIWKFKTPRFKVFNEFDCKVTHFFKKTGEPATYREYCEPFFRIYVVSKGVLIIHLNQFSHYDEGYSMTCERSYFVKCEVSCRVTMGLVAG